MPSTIKHPSGVIFISYILAMKSVSPVNQLKPIKAEQNHKLEIILI